MSDLSDKNIDNIFKSGSEGHNFDYNPEAWKEMEQLLDKEDRRRGLWWWFGLGGLLLLIAGLFYFATNKTDLEIENQAGNISIEKSNAAKKNLQEENINATLKENPANSEYEAEIADEEFNKSSKKSTISNPNPIKKSSETGLAKGQKEGIHSNKIPNGATSKGNLPDVPSELSNSTYQVDKQNISSLDSAQTNNSGTLPTLPLTPFPWGFPLPDAPFEEEPRDSILIVEKREAENPSRFLPGIVFASEISGAGDVHLDYLDWKFGLELQYRFGKHFSASIGANYIKKNYNAAYIDYDVPEGFWVRGISPSYTKGHCSILEIPVQLGYYVKGNDASGFQIQAGLSSYLMLKERYYYYYVEADPDLLFYWHSSNVAKHWMGILQVAPGYQVKTEDGFFRIAPYAQIPLQGVGIGKIKLYSFGLQFNYNFLLKK
ncbi:MAG: hypothetical protein R2784_10145 [Saprospiraceae bacterium]